MIMVSFCWKINFPHNKNKNQFHFIDDVLEINDKSCYILSGPPIGLYYTCGSMGQLLQLNSQLKPVAVNR